jgi:predicted glycoside hydrolase/deacetylase ChbG (UPF0249 family)
LQSVADISAISLSKMLIINADDWGHQRPRLMLQSNVIGKEESHLFSAMVFMEDSERAAELANDNGLDVGVHLNFTEPFTGKNDAPKLRDYHER